MAETKFLYKESKPLQLVFAVAGVIGLTVLFYYIASHNNKQLNYKHIITLSVEEANIVYWAIAAFMSFASAYTIYAAFKLLTREKITRYITITDSFISAPKAKISNEITTVKYSDIIDIKLQVFKKMKTLIIFFNGGKLNINNTCVDEKDFVQICSVIASIKAQKGTNKL